MVISIYPVTIWIISILICGLSLVIYLGSNKLSPRIFAASTFWVAFWALTTGFLISIEDIELATVFNKAGYFISTTIVATFFYFSLAYPYNKKPDIIFPCGLILSQVVFFFLCFYTDLIVGTTSPILSPTRWSWSFGKLSLLFDLYFLGLIIVSIIILYKRYKEAKEYNIKKNLFFIILTTIVGIIPPILMCDIFPRFGYFDLDWFGPITGIIWISVIFYSIIRYHQMNIKTVIAEVLAIGMTVIFFINIFIDTPLGIWDDIIIFLAFFILAIFLMKSILREVKQNEILENFNSLLAEKVDEQTGEIKKLYDSERKNKRELEKLNETKDQFIMVTQHHLRSPVVNIKCGLESIQSGKYGHINPKIQKELNFVSSSVDRLTKIVDDFLSITNLKAGENILNLSYNSLKAPIEDIIQELQINIQEKKISISYSKDIKDWPEVMVDPSKIRDALLIVIENAIRYNIDYGKVTIETSSDKESFKLIISDTGVGINSSDKEKIFNNLFHRSEQAKKANPNGMGIGLSVARSIIRAHHGSLDLESEGERLGTKAIIKIPKDLTASF